MNLEKKKEWQHSQYLNEFRRKFQALMNDWSFNWPDLPNLRDDETNEKFFHSFLVLFINCSDSIERSFAWERK
jgi:hypothetical protein